MNAARQQHGEIDFTAGNRLHVPVALASLLLLPVVVLIGWRRPAYRDLGRLAATVMIAILANAVVCGVLSGPHPRYGPRIVWISSLVILLVPRRVRVLSSLRPARGGRHGPGGPAAGATGLTAGLHSLRPVADVHNGACARFAACVSLTCHPSRG